ncbi:ankyrin repeat domain-containing protein [Wolbachia endosymbiont (group B) of Philonthus cognatus]|uniref:ankyrin repeat domain-containing protein n=1 Tax=Wolbachia endosymbiont (group B) of Philonthus cognatus TaxID=2954047 RepID=UPI00221EB252|nr:ankyrin repeat domain-containing protein [Wolbachia endosymbiont (group B) of Philonthus cognatus]
MLKVEHQIDYSKKEGVNSQVVKPLEEEQRIRQVKRSSQYSQEQDLQQQLDSRPSLKRFKRSDDNLKLPKNFKVGQAIADGNCFFDSFRQGLEQQLGIKVTVKQLRQHCKEFAQNNPPEWFINAIANSHDNNGVVRKETPDSYTGNILNSNRWGDPEVEGRILCEKYRVKLHVIEKHNVDGEEVRTDQIIDSESSKPVNSMNYNEENTIHVVNGGNAHFEPVLNKAKIRNAIQQENHLSSSYNYQPVDSINNRADSSQPGIPSQQTSLDSQPNQPNIDNQRKSYVSQVNTNSHENIELNRFLLLSSRESFENEYQKLHTKNEKIIHYDTERKKYYYINNQGKVDIDVKDIGYKKRKNLYLQTLSELEKTIQAGDINRLRNLSKLISFIHGIEDKTLIKTFYNDDSNPIRNTNLIILACKYNQPKLLDYLLNQSQILHYLSSEGHIKQVDMKKTAFYHAMCSGDVKLLEMLYDYWSGDLHWLGHKTRYDESHVVENLKVLNQLLINARDDYEKQLEIRKGLPQQMLVDIYSIIKFNSFQIELYSELSKLRANSKIGTTDPSEAITRKHEIEAIKNMILTIFRVYEKYSNEDEARLRKSSLKDEAGIKELLLDKSTLYSKYMLYTMYELYFRKLDFNVSLLILDNLYLLKQRLKMPGRSYQKIESKLYHFIYHVSEGWGFYLPKRREKLTSIDIGLHKGFFVGVKSTIDQDRLGYSAVIYLEKRDFQKCLYKFKDELEKTSIIDNIREKVTKMPDEETNSLTLLPYMRDDFSLKKILYYMKELSSVDLKMEKEFGQLIIERILQVIGEFLKSTDESLHLSPATEALLQVEIPIETIRQLKSLRDLLSHVDKGQLLTRIEIEKNKGDIFDKVHEDLQKIKKGINEVIKIHKPRVDKALIQKGIDLLNERIKEMPEEVRKPEVLIYSSMVGDIINNYGYFFKMFQDGFFRRTWSHTGLSMQLLKEVTLISVNQNMLVKKRESARKSINGIMMSKFTQYIKTIQHILQRIDNHNNNWDHIKGLLLQLKVNISTLDYPNEEDVNKIRKELKGGDITLENKEGTLSPIREKLKLVGDLKPQWNFIKRLLEFIVKEVDFFDSNPLEIKGSYYTGYFEHSIINSFPSKEGVRSINLLLEMIEGELYRNGHSHSVPPKTVLLLESDEFKGIKELENMLNKNNYVTKEEKDIVLNNISAEKKEVGSAKLRLISHYNKKVTLERDEYERLVNILEIKKQSKGELKSGYSDTENFISHQSVVKDSHSNYESLLQKLNENVPIDRKDHTKFVTSLKLNNKSEKILLNLVIGEKRDPKLLECLSNRVTLLKKVLLNTNETPKNQLVLRYMHDKKFRALVELLLIDLMNILKESKQKKSLNKISKLLAEINLRNILEHGNPLLEIVGNVLDSNDLPTELISKALTFTEDEKSINALCALIGEDIDPVKIKNNQIDMLSQERQNLVNELKKANKWQDYLKLIPTDYQQQSQQGGSKVLNQVDDQKAKDEGLLKAVKEKDASGTRNFIDQGANVNFIDGHGKASMHYAAMSGNKEIIEVLLKNNANINIADKKDGRSPLHYAAMNGHEEAVKILLVKGANIRITDKDDRGPLYYANQRKHEDIFFLLARDLTVQVGYSLKECLPGSSHRKKRNAENECLFTWEDVDEFNEEKDEIRDLSKINIDSKKFIRYLENLPEEKRSQLIQLASEVKIGGNSQGLVSKLISNQKVMSHLSRVGRISGMTMHGMMAKNVLADFLNGDYQGVAINVGFIAGGQGFAKVAEAASLKGLKLASEGKLLLGRSLRAASPFLARGTSAFVVYDLVNQVKAFKNGTEEALVGVVGDSIYLGVDAAEIGIEIAEAFEVLEGVSSITGPIGATIGAVVFVGTDIYMAVKRVDKIDQIIHLKGNERFIEGLRAFIGMQPEKHIEELIEEKQLYNQLVKQGLEYLKQHSDIQSYVFPTGKSVVDSCRKVSYKTSICDSGGLGGRCLKTRTVTRYAEECTTKFEVDLDNTVQLDRKRTDIKWSRAKPDNPSGGELFCLPRGNHERVPSYGSYLCENAIGLSTKTGNHTLINLGEGTDHAKGFIDSPNIFVVNNGSKRYFGGNKDDIFILQGSSITGYFYGEGGVNTLDLTSFAPEKESIDVKLHIGQVEDYYRKNFFGMSGINKFLGRKAKADQVFITCDSDTSDIKFVDGQSGSEGFVDHINIHDKDCAYEMQIVVRPNTVIYNRALKGDFHYIVPYALGSAKVDFIYTAEALNLNNTFAFEYEPAQIKNVDVRNINVLNKTSHIITFNFSPMSDKEFNITISGASNPSYRLGNNTEIKVGNRGNLYMLENINKSVDEIIKDYLVVANRLNRMSFFIQSLLSNETVAIGSGNYEVIHNNPLQKSHLVGNGGENVYVIDSKRFEIPLPEVVIYDLDVESSVDTIDLKNLVQQAKGKFSNSFELQVLKSANDLLLKATVTEVKPTEDLPVNKIIKHEYFTVRLKDGINWYNKTHVIMDNVPMRINLDNNEWSLKPLPLVFEKDKEVIIVTSQDVEENTELITPRKGGNYTFVRSNSNDLMITNAFDASITKNDLCSITLSKFYEEPKMGTLSIKFADKEVVLKEHQEEISSARDVNVVKKEYKDQVYNDVFNHTKSSPEVIMLSDQPMAHKHRHSRRRQQTRHRRSENITSNGTRPSSWINDLFGWVKSSISGLLSSKSEGTSNTKSSISQVDAKMDVNGTIMLLDVLVRKFTGKKYISGADQSVPLLEARGYALNITKGFEKVVEQAGLKSGVSMHRLNIDYIGMQKEITRKVMSGKFNEISGILKLYVEKACPDEEAGKLSPKKFDKFIAQFNKGLLNQSIEQILHNRDGRLEVDDAKQMSLEPQSYLSNASVHSHSKVSTFLSEIGVTKLRGNLNR